MLIRFTYDGFCGQFFRCVFEEIAISRHICKFNLEFMLGEVKVVEVAIKHELISPSRVQTGESGWRSTICMKVKV